MEDDHVDRPGVEAPQGVELTGTNSSIGLVALINAMLILAFRRQARAATCGVGDEGWPSGEALASPDTGRRVPRHALRLGVRIACRNRQTSLLHPFADLVIIAGWLHPIPFRTRP